MSTREHTEPLPIWFFVGLILTVYGALVVVSGFIPTDRHPILAETHPSLWWGGITTVCGLVFLGIGLRVRALLAKEAEPQGPSISKS